MLRRAWVILLWLVAGLAASTAVAWTMPRAATGVGVFAPLTDHHRALWREHAPLTFQSEPASAYLTRVLGGERLSLVRPGTPPSWQDVQRDRAGWPWLSLESWQWHDGPTRSGTASVLWVGDHFFPRQPLWPGLLANTLVFALFMWAAVRVPRFALGLWRSAHRRCAKCGYPCGASPLCSECGGALPAWSREPNPASPVATLWSHRRGTCIALLLAAGGFMTLATAVALAIIAPGQASPRFTLSHPRDIEWVRAHSPAREIERLLETRTRDTLGVQQLFIHIAADSREPVRATGGRAQPRTYVCRYRAGWPLHAMEGVDWAGTSHWFMWPPPRRVLTSADALIVPRRGPPIVVPLRPRAAGFTINSVFYAGVIAVGLWLRESFIARRRRGAAMR